MQSVMQAEHGTQPPTEAPGRADSAAAAGAALNAELHSVLPALARRASAGGARAAAVLALCEQLEANGGPPAGALIKAKIPTYASVLV